MSRIVFSPGSASCCRAAPCCAGRRRPRRSARRRAKPGLLRVCADPDNMPSSNQKGEGYENKIAELIAKELKRQARATSGSRSAAATSAILNGRYCDLAIEAPAGLDMTGVTKPYFRSGYVFVTRQGSGLEDINSLADPAAQEAQDRRQPATPPTPRTRRPAMALSRYGVVGNLTGYSTFYSDDDRPEDIIKAVANKDVDLAIVWGPLAGYFAKQSAGPPDADAAPRAGLAERLPVPVQHRHGGAPPGQGVPGQPAGACSSASGPRSRPSSRSTESRLSRSERARRERRPAPRSAPG